MATPASLIALASGRLTPLSRSALVLGLTLFVATLALVRPVHQAGGRLAMAPASLRALERGSPWADHAMLQEGASLFMPDSLDDVRATDAAQPDASPFAPFGPELRHDPAKALALPSSASTIRWTRLDEVFPFNEDRPYQTLGQKSPRLTPSPRVLQLDVFSDMNENVFKKAFRASDEFLKNHKPIQNKDLSYMRPAEFRLGLDAMGLQSKPYLLRSSGDATWDQSVGAWLQNLPWGLWLKPGSYRVVIGP